jgi:hypothetical protein
MYNRLPPISRWSMMILMILVMFGAFTIILIPLTEGLMGVFFTLAFGIFG